MMLKGSLLVAILVSVLTVRAGAVPVQAPMMLIPPWIMDKAPPLPEPCQQCCVYDSRYYSEGTVIAIEKGLHLHCIRDKRVSGAYALIWQIRINEPDQNLP